MDKHRIRSLDGLRGIFAAVVMGGHFFLIEVKSPGDQFTNIALAVQFFFILSGVALCFGTQHKFSIGQLSIWGFARQRLARLYPMHLLSMVAAGLFISQIYGTIPTGGNMTLDTGANLLLLQAMGVIPGWSWNVVSWSISTEFWIGILMLPIAIKHLSARVALTLSVSGYAAIFLTAHTFVRPFFRLAPGLTLAAVSTASGMLMGIAIYRMLARRPKDDRGRITLLTGAAEVALLTLVVAVIYDAPRGYAEIVGLVCMPPLIYLSASSNSWFARILACRPLNWLGAISYSLYLFHIPILGALKLARIDTIDNMWLRFSVFSAVVLGASHLLYKCIEDPLYQHFRKPADQAATGRDIAGSAAIRS